MTSGYPSEFMYGGGGGGGGGQSGTRVNGVVGMTTPLVGNQTGLAQFGFQQQQQLRQQLQQQQQQQRQQQQHGMVLQNQIDQRRAELSMGKRSFGDYQTFSYLQKLQQQQQQQQNQNQNQNQNQYMMRSIKQRTIDSSTRFGVPVYQQQQQQQQQQQNVSLLNNSYQVNNNRNQFNSNNNNLFIPTNNNNNNINNNNQLKNPGMNPGLSSLGYSNPRPISAGANVDPPQDIINPEDQKILDTLQELEKQLLDDGGNDELSDITNTEWSEFQSLMTPDSNPNPNPNLNSNSSPSSEQPSASIVPTNNNDSGNNVVLVSSNNNVISPSPTSSTSSCCSATGTAELIMEAATVILEGRNEVAMELLTKLGITAEMTGNSEQRFVYYMRDALRSRAWPPIYPPRVSELRGSEHVSAVYALYDVSPCFKFGLYAANLVMLEAITGAMQEGLKIHVIDFDVVHAAQYVHLLRALAERKAHAPLGEIKITVVETEFGDHGGVPESVREELVGLAERVGVNLKYSSMKRNILDLSRETLGCEEGEAVVVNFAFKLYRVPDESVSVENLRDELLRRVKGISPRAVTLVEQDMNGNTSPFLTRVSEACGYYGALFDSLEAMLPRDNTDRCRIEEGLGRKMVNLIACEMGDRVERAEVFGKWRARMSMAGFKLKPIHQSVVESMRVKLDTSRGGNPGFTVKEENGGVGFGWMGRTLTTASAWR